MQNDRTVEKLYRELGLTPPESIKHLTEDELRDKLRITPNHQWSQRGNVLTCVCEIGRHTTKIPTSHIIEGTDDRGMPVLKRIEV